MQHSLVLVLCLATKHKYRLLEVAKESLDMKFLDVSSFILKVLKRPISILDSCQEYNCSEDRRNIRKQYLPEHLQVKSSSQAPPVCPRDLHE